MKKPRKAIRAVFDANIHPLVEGFAKVFEALREQIHRFLDALTKMNQ